METVHRGWESLIQEEDKDSLMAIERRAGDLSVTPQNPRDNKEAKKTLEVVHVVKCSLPIGKRRPPQKTVDKVVRQREQSTETSGRKTVQDTVMKLMWI